MPIISKAHLIPRGLGLTKAISGGGPLHSIKHEEYMKKTNSKEDFREALKKDQKSSPPIPLKVTKKVHLKCI